MFKARSVTTAALAGIALAIALPAAAGTLGPRLQALASAYHKAPKVTVARAVRGTNGRATNLFSPHVNAAGKVQVYIHYLPGELPSRARLARLGASHILVSRPLGVVQAWVPIAKLHAAAALADVKRLALPVYGRVRGAPAQPGGHDTCSGVPGGLAINKEGIAAENVAPVHALGYTGAGVKVGIISSGVDCIADSRAKGYLPNGVWIDPAFPGAEYEHEAGSGDEGTAMLEMVHAIAPKAKLGFCGFEADGNMTTADFLQCLSDLAAWGADVISDDLGFTKVFYNFGSFRTSTGGNAITEFAQAHPDISLTTSAGNDRQDYYQADYSANTHPGSPGGPPISLSPGYTVGGPWAALEASGRSYNSAMNFGAALEEPSDSSLRVTIRSLNPGVTLFGRLAWDDPAGGPYDDLDLFLLKPDGSVACQPNSNQWCSSTIVQTQAAAQGYPPFESINYTNDTGNTQTLYLVVYCYDCSAHGTHPLNIKLYGFMNGGGTFNYNTNGGISGHAALKAETAAAAACLYNSGAGAWNSSCGFSTFGGNGSFFEPFSSTGPFSHGDWLNGTQPRFKPDITGIDGVTVSGTGGFGLSQPSGGAVFYGTSAASPNVGAVIALLRSAAPNAEPNAAGWKQLVINTANPSALTNFSVNAGGAGLVDATAALASLGQSMTPAITAPTGSPAKVDPATNVQFRGDCGYKGNYAVTRTWSFGKPGSGAPPDATGTTPAPVQYTNGGIYTATFTCRDKFQSQSVHLSVAVQAAAKAGDVSLHTQYETPVKGQFKGSGVGGEQLRYVPSTYSPANGSLDISGRSFTFTPKAGFSGKTSFTYSIDNGVKKSNTATVTITVASKGSSGGGAFGGLGLGLLAGLSALLLLLRRRR